VGVSIYCAIDKENDMAQAFSSNPQKDRGGGTSSTTVLRRHLFEMKLRNGEIRVRISITASEGGIVQLWP
jgi:hypothetical protein